MNKEQDQHFSVTIDRPCSVCGVPFPRSVEVAEIKDALPLLRELVPCPSCKANSEQRARFRRRMIKILDENPTLERLILGKKL